MIVGDGHFTSHRSCRITALMLHPAFQTIDDLASDWADAMLAKKAGNVKLLQDFINSQLAEPWKEAEQKTDIDAIRPHIGDIDSGIVPEGVQLLTAGVDVQADHIWVVILGWGYLSECWLIYAGRIETGDTKDLANYSLVRTFAASTWPLAKDEKTVMRIATTAVDCGYHTDTVIDFCRQCTESHLIAVRGDDKVKARVYHAFKLPDNKSVRYDLNITILKDRLYRLLFESTTPGPGYFHLPGDVTEEILGHFTAEEKRLIRVRYRQELKWVLKDSGKANHLWDASVYATFAAELAGARLLASSEQRLAGRIKIIGRPVKRSKIRTKY
jgi:phage terminase large subunit GpA-like protein